MKVACANGISFSPDGKTMYFCDTSLRIIWAYDYDIETGTPSNRRNFVDFAAKGIRGSPDGATVDAAGGLWSCNHGAGKVTRYKPEDGTIDVVVSLPHGTSKYVTCPALGGKNMDTLFITSL
jgi:sugar lactone lactonase YvrE